MRNKFAGTCYRCGKPVAAGAGHFEKVSSVQAKKWGVPMNAKWMVQHDTCAIRFRGTDQHFLYSNGEASA